MYISGYGVKVKFFCVKTKDFCVLFLVIFLIFREGILSMRGIGGVKIRKHYFLEKVFPLCSKALAFNFLISPADAIEIFFIHEKCKKHENSLWPIKNCFAIFYTCFSCFSWLKILKAIALRSALCGRKVVLIFFAGLGIDEK